MQHNNSGAFVMLLPLEFQFSNYKTTDHKEKTNNILFNYIENRVTWECILRICVLFSHG
jgi:hypothetical protein